MKILFVSTSTAQTTGYARIASILLNYLAGEKGHEIVHFAFQNYDQTRVDRPLHKNITVVDVHTRSKDTFGDDIFCEVVDTEKPDCILIYNDAPVTCRLLNTLLGKPKPCPIIAYVDAVYNYQRLDLFQHIEHYCDHIFTFSEHWKENFEAMGVSSKKITAFPHGIDSPDFFSQPKSEARNRLGLAEHDFIVLNTNRNSYRKAWDITITAFLTFWKNVGCLPHIKLLINCRFDVYEGYDFQHLVSTACLKLGLDADEILHHQILRLGTSGGGYVSDATINDMYNASDIGLNTCVGEGFGLCNAEAGSLGIPQIVTNTGGLGDIFGGFPRMVVDPVCTLTLAQGIDSHSGEIDITRPEDFAAKLEFYYTHPEIRQRDGEMLRRHMKTRYTWSVLLNTFHTHFMEILETPPKLPIYWINAEHRTDRRDAMVRQLSSYDTQTRIPAVYDREHPHIGCMQSHDRAIRMAYEDGHSLVCLCEDDVVFPKEFTDRVYDLLSHLPMGWDCLQCHYVSPTLLKTLTGTQQHQQRLMKGYLMSCACYVLNRKGMRRYLEKVGKHKLTASLDHPKARAEELVYRYVDTYCALYPLVTTREDWGSDIPENGATGLNIDNLNILETITYPSTTSTDILTLPDDLHFIRTSQDLETIFGKRNPSIRVIIPGYGGPQHELKRRLIASNIKKLKTSGIFGRVITRVMQYDPAAPVLEEIDEQYHMDGSKVGTFLHDKCKNAGDDDDVDYVMLLLDDVELMDTLNIQELVKGLDYCDIVSPSLTEKGVYEYMVGSGTNSIKITRACELFCYLMTPAAYRTWHSFLSPKNPWCWGMDLILWDIMNLRVGIFQNQHMRHHLHGVSYVPGIDMPMTQCKDYLATYGKTVEELWASLEKPRYTITFP